MHVLCIGPFEPSKVLISFTFISQSTALSLILSLALQYGFHVDASFPVIWPRFSHIFFIKKLISVRKLGFFAKKMATNKISACIQEIRL